MSEATPTITTEQFRAMQARGRARGRTRRTPGTMNKTEARYAEALAAEQATGMIAWWAFEPVKLRLAPATFYDIDFLVMTADGHLEVREVKGHWEDDARVKVKVAADKFWMLRFVIVTERRKRDGGGWEVEEVGR